jgi:N-methylhydantoinase B
VLLRTVGLRGAEGLAGGGRGGDAVNIHRSGERETVLTPQAHVHLHVQPGDRVYHKVHGSGGYGDPYERDPEAVVLDVIEGKISTERAREVYGVMIDPEQLTLNHEGTLALRSKIKQPLVAAAD